MKTSLLSKTVFAVAVAALLSTSSTVFAQVKIGTNPTVIGTNENLEVEGSTAGRKTSVDKVTGQVTIADGTQGTGKVFTSDANGGGSWQTSQLVKATVNYTSDGVVTVPQAAIGNYAGATPGNITVTFPENGTYAVSWAFIGDCPSPLPAGNGWFAVLLGTPTTLILNHQDNLIPGSLFVFSSGSRYITITGAPVTLQVRYLNTTSVPFTVRGNSTGNYNDWFGYKVF